MAMRINPNTGRESRSPCFNLFSKERIMMPKNENNKTIQVKTTLTLHEDHDAVTLKLLSQSENKAHTLRQLQRLGVKYIVTNNLIPEIEDMPEVIDLKGNINNVH